jgi:hypothetical protein
MATEGTTEDMEDMKVDTVAMKAGTAKKESMVPTLLANMLLANTLLVNTLVASTLVASMPLANMLLAVNMEVMKAMKDTAVSLQHPIGT